MPRPFENVFAPVISMIMREKSVGTAGAVDSAAGSHGALSFALLRSSNLVGEEGAACSGRFGTDETQLLETISLVEQTPTPTQQDGIHDQDQLIQQILVEQGAHERETAMHAYVFPRLLLQLSDRLGNVSTDDGCGLPFCDSAQGGRNDVLVDRVDEARKGGFVGRGGPEGGPFVIRHAPKQDGVLLVDHLHHEGPHIVIKLLDPIARLDDTIECC